MIHLVIEQNEDGTHTLLVTGSAEDIAAITKFLVASIEELQAEFPEDDGYVG